MLFCEEIHLDVWRPDFSSSGQSSPMWTRVTCLGNVLCNSLEWVQWEENPVQVVVCDSCGHEGCSSGGYAHLSRLHDWLVWTRPEIDEGDAWARDQYEA